MFIVISECDRYAVYKLSFLVFCVYFVKMKKSQVYYYEDVVFQMELSLQSVRRDLVTLLEEHKFPDCLSCNRLKCECSKKSSLRSTTESVASSDSAFSNESDHNSSDMYYNAAPPADTLPTPRWPENKTSNEPAKAAVEKASQTALNNWVRASIPDITQSTSGVSFPVPAKVLDSVNYSWPPFPKSIWSDETLNETTARERILSNETEGDGNSSVEAFFRCFGRNEAIPKPAFAC